MRPEDLSVPYAEVSRWGDAARRIVERLGGRWPAGPDKELVLVREVGLVCDENRRPVCWQPYDVDRLAALCCGGRRLGRGEGGGVEVPLAAENEDGMVVIEVDRATR